MNEPTMMDRCHRVVNYLRLSVTDRCNLRCRYCMAESGIQCLPHEEILTYEEILRITGMMAGMGICKVRITGGEPLVRKDLCEFIPRLFEIPGIREITLTTNGVLLSGFAEALKAGGIRRVNVSLDSLRPASFAQLTGRDAFHRVWEGIRRVEELEFHPIKLNMVVIKGWNDDELEDFARLTLKSPYHVRFIEFMPLGGPIRWHPDLVVPSHEVRRRIQSVGDLLPVRRGELDGPAERLKFRDSAGEIGFVSAVSHEFCSTCNRLRLTAEGRLRACLFSDVEADLKGPLRMGCSDQELSEIVCRAVSEKSRWRGPAMDRQTVGRKMWSIGG